MTRFTWFTGVTMQKSQRLPSDVLPWLLALVGLIVVGGVVIFLVRRYLHSEPSSSSGGFTLQDLRDLHAAGELTDEEFERAKAQMIGRLAAPAQSTDPDQMPSSPGNGDSSSH